MGRGLWTRDRLRRRRVVLGTGGLLASDTFTRTAAVIGTPDTGPAWTLHAGTAATNGATLTLTGAGALASVAVGAADLEASADLSHASAQQHVVVRFMDSENHLFAGFQAASTSLTLWRKQSGQGFTAIGTYAAAAHTGAVRVVARGTSISVYLNGVLRISVTEAAFVTTGTGAGLFGDGGTFDNFVVRSA